MPKEEKDIREQQWNRFIDEICQNTWKELYRYVYYKVQNREEAEDITQETYERALSSLSKRNIEILEYSSYLKAISLNIIKDRWRSRQRKAKSINIEEVNPDEMAMEDFTDALAYHSMIEMAIERLTKEQQTVINLRIIKGFSAAETAKMMNKKEGTIRVLQYRAIKALGKIFEEIEQKEG